MGKKDVVTALPLVGPAIARWIDRCDVIAANDQALAMSSPMVLVLGTDHDELCDWITAGEAMEAVLLRASALGLAASFLNQPIEEPALRRPISAASHHPGHVQLVLRVGWAPASSATPRRDLDDVVASST
jgi:hypothetical protein